jgi:flagellar basal-body rod protein FlgF
MIPDGVGARALRYWETKQAAAANNLANASTPGFKAERVFARLLDDAQMVAGSATDFSSGALNPTGRPLDVAIVGDGFLVVDTPQGSRWMRGGSLSLNAEGMLTDSAGRSVMGQRGPIVIPEGEVQVGEDGAISVDGAPLDRLLVERPGSDERLVREGANYWIAPEAREVVGIDQIQVRQGHLEDSNVDPVGALVDMIEIQRAYSAVQRSMISADEVMKTITTEIGRVG